MTPEQFVEKWSAAELSEKAASQEHFIDLCHLIGEPTPATVDATGEEYTFEKPVKVTLSASKGSKGDSGFVDVWKKGCFAWEYKRKGKYKTLDEAYRQLYQYRDALDNPPLSVVCDIRTTEIRTHFPGYPTVKTTIRLEEVPGKLHTLRRVFTDSESFKPPKKAEEVTLDLANEFGKLADRLIERYPPNDLHLFQGAGDPVAHFLMKVMFCLFAEDIGLLPDKAFTKIVRKSQEDPDKFAERAGRLFAAMSTGGEYGSDDIPYFNGGLFDDKPPLPLTHGDLTILRLVAEKDWAAVEPSIFGTLFERLLDPKKRAQIGAHYTSKSDIMLVVEPVMIAPLRDAWQAVRDELKDALANHDSEPDRKRRDLFSSPIRFRLDELRQFLGEQRILDPACGSGNFLYVALQQLLDLDDEIVRFAGHHDISLNPVPYVRPVRDGRPQVMGIEINRYAAELAQVVIWIGYLQWLSVRGIDPPHNPILSKLDCIDNRDAILYLTDKNIPIQTTWPAADFIIGNPPFLGVRMFRESGLSTEYLTALGRAYDLPRTSDLCCYWFERAHSITRESPVRVGLLATQAIRGRDNREVLNRIATDCTIFWAWSNRKWTTEGADVRVSMVGFAARAKGPFFLDNQEVAKINPDLSSGSDVTTATAIAGMQTLSFQGPVKVGPFEIGTPIARQFLATPSGLGSSISNVVKRWYNGSAITKRWAGEWIIDFATMSYAEAALYEAPFEYVAGVVKPAREGNRRTGRAERWWLFGEPNPKMRVKLSGLRRFIATPRVSKYRLFIWLDTDVIPDGRVVGLATDSDYLFGVVQSSIHELWTFKTGPWHGVGNDLTYNNTVSFDTFALPWPVGEEDVKHSAHERIAEAAKDLNVRRERWLNPPEWIEPIAERIDATDDFSDVPIDARPLIRQSVIMTVAANDTRLKKRTLTNLYNDRPTWLKLAHKQLDRAVLAAYAATDPVGDWEEGWADVWLDTDAGQALPSDHALSATRIEVNQRVLANLLRLNRARAAAAAPKKARRGR